MMLVSLLVPLVAPWGRLTSCPHTRFAPNGHPLVCRFPLPLSLRLLSHLFLVFADPGLFFLLLRLLPRQLCCLAPGDVGSLRVKRPLPLGLFLGFLLLDLLLVLLP